MEEYKYSMGQLVAMSDSDINVAIIEIRARRDELSRYIESMADNWPIVRYRRLGEALVALKAERVRRDKR